jgi:pantoate--beta-alanine ligase
MQICYTIQSLKQALLAYSEKSIGFVPTMGALHQGHLSIIQKALLDNDVVVCSVFVNPTQFNNAEDLKVYPRNIESDSNELEKAGCNILFAPSINEIYPHSQDVSHFDVDFGSLTKVMEAHFRPGHFNGVIAVVKRLFEIVNPSKAYFGEKDFQQLSIVKKLTHNFGFQIEIVGCPIIREDDGLAMSSRNMNLSNSEREAAKLIPLLLKRSIEHYKTNGLTATKAWVKEQINQHPILELEYFEVADSATLESIEKFNSQNARAFMVVFAGKTRLIDNMPIN